MNNANRRLPYLSHLGTIAGLSVYLVSGEHVRDHLDIDFTMGGNEAVYPRYVPRGEIWIDDAAHALDRHATALHEIVERDQMMRLHKSYEDAHDVASAHERPFRAELAKHRPLRDEFSTARVAAAYRAYQRAPDVYPIIGRPNDRLRGPRELDQEIKAALGSRRR